MKNTQMTWMRYFLPSHIIFTHKNLLFFFMVYSHFPLMKVHPHPQNPSCQLIVHCTWFHMDDPYGPFAEKWTFSSMSFFLKPAAHSTMKIGIKKWLYILWICLEKYFWAKKTDIFHFFFLNLSPALLHFGAPQLPSLQELVSLIFRSSFF